MKRISLDERILPKYTKGEEIFNMVSHIVGAALGIVAIVLCAIFGAIHKNAYAVVSGCIFGVTLVLLYTMSSIYHGLNPNCKAKKVFQILDHCSIFILIAGTYTPMTLCTLREYNVGLGWWIFGIVWAVAIVGIVFNSIDLHKFKIFSMICYLVLGWCIIFRFNIIFDSLGIIGALLLLIGGISYTLGAILYGLGSKHKWMHSIFHISCVIGSLLHFLCILIYVI